MSIQLFRKNGDGEVESSLFAPERFRNALAGEWVLDPKELEERPTKEEADTNDTGKLSNKEVRAAAKKAGIEEWETARVVNLKKQLGYS